MLLTASSTEVFSLRDKNKIDQSVRREATRAAFRDSKEVLVIINY